MSVYHLGKLWDSHLEPTDIQSVWNHPEFRSLDDLVVKHGKSIKSECLSLLRDKTMTNMSEFDPQHAALMKDDSWKIILLKYFGHGIIQSGTIGQITRHPIVYNASLSILEPGGVIPLHVGQCKGLVKYHIPISIPEGDVGMWYDGKIYRWTDRMLFDDTKQHTVWNRTSKSRIIILMDILRPMPRPWNIINHRLASLAWLDPQVRRRYRDLK